MLQCCIKSCNASNTSPIPLPIQPAPKCCCYITIPCNPLSFYVNTVKERIFSISVQVLCTLQRLKAFLRLSSAIPTGLTLSHIRFRYSIHSNNIISFLTQKLNHISQETENNSYSQMLTLRGIKAYTSKQEH